MTKGETIENLRKESLEAESQRNYGRVITLSQEIIKLLGNDRSHLRMAAFQWELIARMHLRLSEPAKAEMAAKSSIDTYLRYRKEVGGSWSPDRDCYLADFRMTMALSLAYQKRFAEALEYAELWEKVHLKVRKMDDPFITGVVVPHMRRLRAREAGEPVPEDSL